jgi:hypothetical protein
MWQRRAAAPREETAPLLTQETAGVLSLKVSMVACLRQWLWAMMSAWTRMAACSRLLEVVRGDQVGLDVSQERVSPVVALAGVVKEDPTYASMGCIGGA